MDPDPLSYLQYVQKVLSKSRNLYKDFLDDDFLWHYLIPETISNKGYNKNSLVLYVQEVLTYII